MSRDTNERLLRANEAAEMLGVAPQTLADWRCTDRVSLPFVKIGAKAVRYRLSDLVAFIEANRVERVAVGR